MNRVYKIISFFAISLGAAIAGASIQSNFANKFAENILPLLATLFAINIASSTLIAGKIRELQDATGHPFSKTKKSLKASFLEQIVFIVLVFIAGLLRESLLLRELLGCRLLIAGCDTFIFMSFVYYLDIIWDIGKSLFDLLDFDDKKKGT